MAHITEIKIEGLLGRTDSIHLQFNRGVNVIFGENGCGKTTLPKVLDAALQRDGAAMERLPVTKAVVDIFSVEENRGQARLGAQYGVRGIAKHSTSQSAAWRRVRRDA